MNSTNSTLSCIWTLGCILVLQMFFLIPGDAKFIQGHMTTASNFNFIDRFCFQPNEKGTLHYEIKYKAENCCYKLLMFNDEPGQWPYIRQHEDTLTCGEKKETIPGTYNSKLTLTDGYNGCKKVTDSDGIEWMHCVGGRSFQTPRARWWYFVMSNCYSDVAMDFDYNITMTNGVKLWDKHFSADERYILETNLVFMVLYFFLFVITLRFSKILSERRLLHSTYKLYAFSVLAEFSSLILMTIAYGMYGTSGLPYPGLEMFANCVESAGILVFILMIILLGKGFTITRGKLSEVSLTKLAVFMTVYTIVYCALYFCEETMFDPRDVLYKYESYAGYGLIGLYFIGFVWTHYAIYFSIKHYPDMVEFYVHFGVVFSFWWLATPVTILVCNYAIDAWVRAKVVNAIERVVICIGHIFFLILTRPNAANRNFPFRIKTTQIDSKKGYFPEAYTGTPSVLRAEAGQITNLKFTDIFVTDKTPKVKQPEQSQGDSGVSSAITLDAWIEREGLWALRNNVIEEH
ncbi:transmembrane protein 145-like isoform X1 [Ptychodera flava]|uniref:transmembrane protein 145-like isoform X1 n=2 Tax=Ptychodera flava TaxID=63121 RepID=UPI00396A7C10